MKARKRRRGRPEASSLCVSFSSATGAARRVVRRGPRGPLSLSPFWLFFYDSYRNRCATFSRKPLSLSPCVCYLTRIVAAESTKKFGRSPSVHVDVRRLITRFRVDTATLLDPMQMSVLTSHSFVSRFSNFKLSPSSNR